MMTPLDLAPLSQTQLDEWATVYRTTQEVRRRTRAPLILLAAEPKRSAPPLATWVRETDQPVRKGFQRSQAEGMAGLHPTPQPGAPTKVTPEYEAQWFEAVRWRPRRLGLPYSLWTLARLADYLAQQTGSRVEAETVRCHLTAADLVLSRPPHTRSRPDPDYQVTQRRWKPPGRP